MHALVCSLLRPAGSGLLRKPQLSDSLPDFLLEEHVLRAQATSPPRVPSCLPGLRNLGCLRPRPWGHLEEARVFSGQARYPLSFPRRSHPVHRCLQQLCLRLLLTFSTVYTLPHDFHDPLQADQNSAQPSLGYSVVLLDEDASRLRPSVDGTCRSCSKDIQNPRTPLNLPQSPLYPRSFLLQTHRRCGCSVYAKSCCHSVTPGPNWGKNTINTGRTPRHQESKDGEVLVPLAPTNCCCRCDDGSHVQKKRPSLPPVTILQKRGTDDLEAF